MGNQWQTRLSAVLSDVRLRPQEWWQQLRLALVGTPPQTCEPEPEAPTKALRSGLYQHTMYPHKPRNVNHIHRAEQEAGGFNTRVAVWLTKNVGTMQCAYLFAGIGIGSLVGVATGSVVLAAVFGSLSSYFLQLVLLPILSVGQNVLGRHQELQADETFKTSQRSFHDIEEIMAHLSAQDEELLKQSSLLLKLCGEPVPEEPPSLPARVAPTGKEQKAKPSRTHVTGSRNTAS